MVGIVGSSIDEIFHFFDKRVSVNQIRLIWALLLIGAVTLFYLLRNKPLRYLTLILIAVLLYVIDFIIYDSLNYDIADTKTRNLTIGITVIAKSIAFSLIFYFGSNEKKFDN